jgi:Zn-dependent protease
VRRYNAKRRVRRGPLIDTPTFYELLSALRVPLPPIGIALVVALLVISLGIHEAAHGWVALQRGDPTARDLGRITLNPLPHIDPFLTILLPLMTYLSMGFFFGGARPVPVDFHSLRNPWRDMALVALAGPLSNFLLAAFFLLTRCLLVGGSGPWHEGALGDTVLLFAVYFNLLLAAFNLLPIPPLDGSRVAAWLLPSSMRDAYATIERLGVGLLLVLLLMQFVPVVNRVVYQTVEFFYDSVVALITLGGLW